MRQAIAVAGHGIVEPPLESNQPCLHTRAAHQIALKRHNRSSPRTVLSSSGDTVRRLRSVSESLSALPMVPCYTMKYCNRNAMTV